MATYTVIQDIEAEDKFLGPLTLKQFIFGAIGVFFGYLSFFAVSQGAAFLLVIFLPPSLLGFFLAFPWSSEQPTERWVLAKLSFRFKPRARIWDQAGLEELVTINVPKKVEKHLTNGLDQTEVQSRLKALAATIDSRGWAVKNLTLDERATNNYLPEGDRLINPATLPRPVPDIDLAGYRDVLDEDTAVSENFDHMIQTSTNARRQQSLDKMERIRHGEPLEAARQPAISFTPPPDAYMPSIANTAMDEQLLSAELRNKRSAGDLANSHMRTVSSQQPVQPPQYPAAQTSQGEAATVAEPPAEQPQAEMTRPVDPDILELAQNNDLNIATLARQAHRKDQSENEVVISLR